MTHRLEASLIQKHGPINMAINELMHVVQAMTYHAAGCDDCRTSESCDVSDEFHQQVWKARIDILKLADDCNKPTI